jgi:hypothetical protein
MAATVNHISKVRNVSASIMRPRWVSDKSEQHSSAEIRTQPQTQNHSNCRRQPEASTV